MMFEETQRIEMRVSKILKSLSSKKYAKNNVGILSGIAGHAIFYAYASRFLNDDNCLLKSNKLLKIALNQMNKSEKLNATYSSGLCGILWAIKHLNENDFIQVEDKNFFKDGNFVIEKHALEYIMHGNIDFLHGSIGLALYLLKFDRRDFHNEFILKLYKLAIKDLKKDTITWDFYILNNELIFERVSNFGLSHGLASVLGYLLKYKKKYGDTNTLCNEMYSKIINYFLSNIQDVTEKKSFFPNWLSKTNNSYESGIRWCYGDLTIGYILLQCSLYNDYNGALKLFSLKVLKHTCNRRKIGNNFDCGFCHGAFGIFHIYKELYFCTSDNLFLDTANYWYNLSINKSNYNSSESGWLSYNTSESWHENDGLLEGNSGIGLVLIDANSETKSNWSEFFLLS
ncbi:MAG: hypothetical protein JSU07_03645 [Bacteroidetes bacterium]|nr:hypothetical protein [Bacteroidota bacterium]